MDTKLIASDVPYTIVLFGPVSGFASFSLPKQSAPQGVNLPLPTSEVSLQEGGRALRLVRGPDQGLWIALYNQVYDQLGGRAGHTFGAGLYLRNRVLEASAIYKIIENFSDFLGQRCLVEGRKFDSNSWSAKALPEVESRFQAFMDLWSDKLKPMPQGGGLSNASDKIACAEVLEWSGKERIIQFIEWSVRSPGAISYSALNVCDALAIQEGKNIRRIESMEQENLNAYLQLQQKQQELENRVAHLQRDTERLREKNANSTTEVQQLRSDLGKRDARIRELGAQSNKPTKVQLTRPIMAAAYANERAPLSNELREMQYSVSRIKLLATVSLAGALVCLVIVGTLAYYLVRVKLDHQENHLKELKSEVKNLELTVQKLSDTKKSQSTAAPNVDKLMAPVPSVSNGLTQKPARSKTTH